MCLQLAACVEAGVEAFLFAFSCDGDSVDAILSLSAEYSPIVLKYSVLFVVMRYVVFVVGLLLLLF
jgi:hypothetical protein